MAILVSKSDNDDNFDGQGTVYVTDPDYGTCHGHAGESVTNYNRVHTAGQRYNIYGNGDYQIFRCVIRFDLARLPAGDPVSSAVMSILAGSEVFHHTDWNFTLVDGSDCVDPLVAEDYGDLLGKVTSLGAVTVSTITESTRFEITLNAAGRSFLESKAGGVAIFAIRSSDDIGSIPPPDYDLGRKTEMNFSTSMGAAEADKPTLTITYTTEPEVTTNPATEVEATIATLKGTLQDDGGEACDVRFQYGETSDYGIDTEWQSGKESVVAFEQAITGLSPNKTYHFRAQARNSAGTVNGADRTFSTPLGVPAVTTDPATALSAIAATLNGTLDSDGGEACDCGFEWGLDTGYGITTPTESKGKGETFSQVIHGLFSGTTYHFRAIATNSVGTGYGADETFTTALVISRAFALAREEL